MRAMFLRVQEGARNSQRLDPESQQAALGRASMLPLGPKDTRKARDAMIVAIGISSVLIINVAYVGYITTPGGQDPYWADCFYPVFVAYFVLNGFALVFSVAALCAVTWGPFVLIWRRVSTWRTRVVNLGLVHLAVSLASLLGAFACAGFVVASVGAPELTCGNVKCTDGGVPCSAFIQMRGANHVSANGYAWRPWTFVLDPVLAKLNNATFGDFKGRTAPKGISNGIDVSEQDVICHSYSHVALFSDLGCKTDNACASRCATAFDGLHGNGVLDGADGMPVNSTCFVLLDAYVFEGGFDVPRLLEPATFWCSINGSGLGPGWLPLQLGAAQQLLQIGDVLTTQYNTTDDGYAVEGPKERCISTCPQVPGIDRLARPLLPGPFPTEGELSTSTPRAVELQVGSHPMKISDQSCMNSLHEGDGGDYVRALVGGWTEVQNCVVKLHRSQSAEAENRKKESTVFGGAALAGYYPSLQYQCSKSYDGVLCDYSVNPPLSVDAEGRFMDKKSLAKQSNARFAKSLTTTSVQYAVVAMLAVAFVAIFGTLAGLGGAQVAYEGLWFSGAFIHRRVSWALGRCSGTARK